MQRMRMLSLVTVVALIASLLLTAVAGANPPAPGDEPAAGRTTVDITPGGAKTNPGKTIDQPNLKDYQRNVERQRLLANGQYLEAQALSLNADDRVLVILVEFAGTDTFTWNPGDKWDPLGRADLNEEVLDANGVTINGDCSKIITETKTFTYSGPLHNEIPRPLSAADRSGDTIWTEDFSADWFKAFMWGDGVKFQYTREDGSVVDEDFTGQSVKDYFLDMSGGDYEIAGDVIGWVQVPHSTWWYGADTCPGRRSGSTMVSSHNGAIPGAGSSRSLVKDSLDAVNAISNTIPGFDWHNYDQDGDGVIDRLWIVHAGYGQEDSTILTNRTDYGEAANWSHSSAVTPAYKVAPDVAAGPYIMMPENGGIGVFAHEYAHNLGADDVYSYGNGDTSAGFWALQADDWTGFPIGYEPPSADAMHLDWWGWLQPKVISDPSQTYTFKLGQASRFPGGDNTYRGAKIELPDGEAPLPVSVWQGDSYWWGGKEDVANASMTTAEPVAIPAGGATLSFDAAYGVETLWDFLWVQASEDGTNWTTLTNANTVCDHDPSWIGGEYGFPEDMCAAGIGGLTDYNHSFPEPDTETFDLAAFAGKNVWLRLWYMTDWGTTYEGPFIDNVKVMAGDTVLFADDAEYGDAKWTYVAPWQRSSGVQSFGHRFYLQWRNTTETGGYDSALGDARWRFGPADTGMIVWYNNDFYGDNEIENYLTDFPSFGPKGVLLVADSHPQPLRDPNWVIAGYPNMQANWTARGQMRDAPFSLNDTNAFTADMGKGPVDYPSRPAVSSFHDSYGYYPGVEFAKRSPVQTAAWLAKQWDAATVMPAKSNYSVKANQAGFGPSTALRYRCLAPNAAGALACYWFSGGVGVPGGSGNPGDVLAQYGWHVQIVDQTDSVATVKVWNSLYDFQGAVTQTPSSDPMVMGSTVKVDVKATNVGSPINGLFIAPLDAEEDYVPGSAYGGAFPVTEAQVQALTKQSGAKVEGMPRAEEAGDIIGVAAMAKPGTGGAVNFGFSTVITAKTGEIQHSVAVFDTSKFVTALDSDALTIQKASEQVTDDFVAVADSHISRGMASTNNGDWPFIYVGGDDVLRGLVQFDVSAIDATFPVDKATLSLYVGGFGGGGSVADLAAFAVNTAWAENTVTWSAPWATPGGDVDAMAVGKTSISRTDVGGWVTIDVTAAAQRWVANGAMNHGVLVRLVNPSSFTTYRFVSTENGWMGQYAPKLEVMYRVP